MSEPTDAELDALLARARLSDEPDDACIDDGVLIAHREGRLDAEHVQRIDRHLVRCAPCRELAALLAEPVPAALEQRAVESAARSRRPRPWGALALAATLVLSTSVGMWALTRAPDAAVPEYASVEVLGGIRPVRNTSALGVHRFAPDGTVRLLLRPTAAYSGPPLALEVHVERADGRRELATTGTVTRGDDGILRFEAEAGKLLGHIAGSHRIHLVVRQRDDASATDTRALFVDLTLELSEEL